MLLTAFLDSYLHFSAGLTMARARKVPAKARRMQRTAEEEPQVATDTPKSLKRLKPDTPTGAGTRTDAQTMITSASKRRRPGEQYKH